MRCTCMGIEREDESLAEWEQQNPLPLSVKNVWGGLPGDSSLARRELRVEPNDRWHTSYSM